jgi:hypothetical protein
MAVEYSPPSLKNRARHIQALYEGIGEESVEAFAKARRGKGTSSDIPVRFPLVCPNTCSEKYPNERRADDPLHLEEEGVLLPARHLYPVKRTPLSLFKRLVYHHGISDFGALLGDDVYFSTHSRDKFFAGIKALEKMFPLCWTWKEELTPSKKGGAPNVFLEGRFYGGDNAVGMCRGGELQGVVFEVIFRRIDYCRTRRNVYLCANGDDGITYIDGVQATKPPKSVPGAWSQTLRKSWAKMLTFKDAAKYRRDKNAEDIKSKTAATEKGKK